MPASMRARLAEAGPAFLTKVRTVIDEGRLDETFVDATCDPPQVFTYGGMIAHVLTFAAHRRTLVCGALHRRRGHRPRRGRPDALGRGRLTPASSIIDDPGVTTLEAQALAWIEPYWNAEHLRRTRDWLLELEPEASEALRLAALTHDIERHFPGGPVNDLAVPPEQETEYRRRHAERSAAYVEEWLRARRASGRAARDGPRPDPGPRDRRRRRPGPAAGRRLAARSSRSTPTSPAAGPPRAGAASSAGSTSTAGCTSGSRSSAPASSPPRCTSAPSTEQPVR